MSTSQESTGLPASTEIAVEAQGIGRRFGRRWVLAHVDLRIARGESVLLAGANGSGKTTLLRVLAGLSTPTAGSVQVFGLSPHKERLAARRAISMVSHQSYLYDGLTASEMLRIWSRLGRNDASEERLANLLTEVGLETHGDQLVGGFSAGMRKRLTLLRTRIERPDILFLDEPLASLDGAGIQLVERWIERELQAGTTIVIASHAIERMARICRRAVLLEDGQVVWDGAAEQLPSMMEIPA